MRGSKSKLLSSLFGSASKNLIKASSDSTERSTLAQLQPLFDASSSGTSISSSESIVKKLNKPKVGLSKEGFSSNKPPSITARESVSLNSSSSRYRSRSGGSDESEIALVNAISTIFSGIKGSCSEPSSLPASDIPNDEESLDNIFDIPWLSSTSKTFASQRRKELSRERKSKWIFKKTQARRFDSLVTTCGNKLGAEVTLEVFGRLGRETGVKEYSAMIRLCLENARESLDAEGSFDHIYKALKLFNTMREQGFQLEETLYGPVLLYLIDMEMVEEFHILSKAIKDEHPCRYSRLGYYEMLLWCRVDDNDKIQELCDAITANASDKFDLAESYMLALSESERMEELFQVLDVVDVTKVSNFNCMSSIFKSLGRLSMEDFAEKFILALKTPETEAEKLSIFIFDYSTSIPNLEIEDAISKFKMLHEKLDVVPTSASYMKLVVYCCENLKVHAAIDMVEQMSQLGFVLSVDIFYRILHAVEESSEIDLVHRIYSMMGHHNLKPNSETYRSMINLCAKMKDFKGAYNMLTDLKDMDIKPTANIYNAIMAGYFREKNVHAGLMVFKQMKEAGVQPDSQTFSNIIGNCESEEDIVKYHEEMQRDGVHATKHVYMALINAYVDCGQFQKAMEIVADREVPVKYLNEVQSALVTALASHGQMSDALEIYDKIKKQGCYLEPRASISIIEHLQSEGELERLLQLLSEVTNPDLWYDGCERVILYCVRHNILRTAVDLLKQLKAMDEISIHMVIIQAFCQIWEAESTSMEFGLDLLKAIKETVGIRPCRTSLDFLLTTCISAKDLDSSWLIWKEYPEAGLVYNSLSYLRMYQVLLACGDTQNAKTMLKRVPRDDPHIRKIIKESEATFRTSTAINAHIRKIIKESEATFRTSTATNAKATKASKSVITNIGKIIKESEATFRTSTATNAKATEASKSVKTKKKKKKAK